MTGVLRFSFIAALSVCLYGCAGLHEAAPEISGNNTGGVIPQKMAATQNVQALATAHCARWNLVPRITFPASQTGGEVVFICERAGQAPQAMPDPEPAQPPAKPAPKKKTK